MTIYVEAIVECDRCKKREKHTLKSKGPYPNSTPWDTKLVLPEGWYNRTERNLDLPYQDQAVFHGDACPSCGTALYEEDLARSRAREERERAAKARREAAEHEARLAATAEKGSFRT